MSIDKKIFAFADKLCLASQMLRDSTVRMRGQKALSRRTRVLLSEVKNEITKIKKMTLENENE